MRLKNVVGLLSILALGTSAVRAEAAVPISVSDASTIEGNSGSRSLTFTASLPQSLPYDLVVKYNTFDLTAKAGPDFSPIKAGKLTFKVGQTSASIKVAVLGDQGEEKDEQFGLQFTEANGEPLSDISARGTIFDDDYAGQISVSDFNAKEGDSNLQQAAFKVALSRPALHELRVDVLVTGQTASPFADYAFTPASRTLVFAPGQMTRFAVLWVVGDLTAEANETLAIKLTAPNYTLSKSIATGTILNDDGVLPAAAGRGKIAYIGGSFTKLGLHVMNGDGSQQTRLNLSVHCTSPTFSPDGNRIAFTGSHFQDQNIWTVGSNGQGEKQLTTDNLSMAPRFSPDGSKIAFISYRAGNGPQIFLMNSNGTGQKQLTKENVNAKPCFSPDGQKIAYESKIAGTTYVCIMNADGTSKKKVIAGLAHNPIFLPNGKTMALFSNGEQNVAGIYLVDLASGKQTLVTTEGASMFELVMSHDGGKFAWVSYRDGQHNVYIVNNNGTEFRRLTPNKVWYSQPCFSPDGDKVAYTLDLLQGPGVPTELHS
ncbi:DUF5050 domain-containing protein, partial [bacterium]